MNIRKHQELLNFWEYSHNFDSEDGAVSIDEDITFEASQQELQIELEHFNEMELEQELHPIKDDDFQPEDEHPNKTMLKRELRAIALKRLKDVAPLAIVIPAPINHAYWRQLMKGDYIDIISNCPYEMHNSLSDEDYSKIIYELKDDHKELIYFLYLRDFTTSQLAALRNQSDRNIRGVRSTILGQIEKKVLMILVDRQGEEFPFTMEELSFLSRHEENIPATIEKLDKEKLALLKEIGVVVRRIARQQEKRAKEKAKKQKKNNDTNQKKEV